VKDLRQRVALGLILLLSGCVSERHFTEDLWPFGNPNAPPIQSETAQRAIGRQVAVTPIPPQAGDVWPGPVQPMPTLGDVQKNANTPLGQDYTPSLPSPYPPGQDPADQPPPAVLPPGSIYPSPAAPSGTN
jgi:hypothetical protein